MRIESIELLRYGHFTDHTLRFPRRETDFHLVYGDNEAGKSTLRQAFHDLFFGIPMNTPMAFLHAGPDLAINAVLSGELGELTLGRRRKRVGGLVDGAGQVMPEEQWARWLEGVTPAFHERMFGLDHQRLEQGSRAMLQAGDDVDSVLFQAAAGLATLNGVLTALREEAAGLWTPHHSRSRAWYVANDRYKEAEKALRTATVRPTTWVTAERESRRADEAFTAARDACNRLRTRVLDLERLRRLAPLLVQIKECEQQLQALEPKLRGPLLELESDILALEATRLRIADHPNAMAQSESQMGLLREQLADVLRQLGRTLPEGGKGLQDLEALAAGLPPLPLRQALTQLISEGQDLKRSWEAAAQARAERETEVQELRQRIAALPAQVVGTGLRRSVQAAAAAADLAATRAALQDQTAKEEAALVQRLQALRQPELDTELGLTQTQPLDARATERMLTWLAGMQAWPSDALVEQVQVRQGLRASLDTAAKRVRDAELELATAQLKVDQFRRSHEAVSRDQVLAARRDRDALWAAFVAGEKALAAHAQDFSAKLLLSDTLADRHLEAVDDAARLQALEHDCERLERTLQGLQQTQATAEAELQAYDAQWQQDCAQRGLPALLPAALQGWLPGCEAALAAHQRLIESRAQLNKLDQHHDAVLGQLRAALAAEAAALAPAAAHAGLAETCELAQQLLARADSTVARREALTEQLQRLEPLLPSLQREAQRSEAAYQACLERRQSALQRACLPDTADDAYAEAAINLFADADRLINRLRELQADREQRRIERQTFLEAVADLAARLQWSGFQADAAEDHLRAWVTELTPLRAAQRDCEQARQRLQGLVESLHEAAEGRAREDVEAELAQVNVATLPAEAEDLRAQLEVAEQERDRLAIERQNAQQALLAISGSDEAARAEAMRQEALADMGEVAERYVHVYAQQRLLEHITERYRERSQGPLLARAGQLFSALTLGAYAGLEIDGDVATLLARRADARLVPLGGLSDGTRDQLYLALRLAALELYLGGARPMPFIADDLFINYDDRRSLAGLKQLVEISKRTQVIFLTHHAHVVELVRSHLAEQVHVLSLSSPHDAML